MSLTLTDTTRTIFLSNRAYMLQLSAFEKMYIVAFTAEIDLLGSMFGVSILRLHPDSGSCSGSYYNSPPPPPPGGASGYYYPPPYKSYPSGPTPPPPNPIVNWSIREFGEQVQHTLPVRMPSKG
ncbi:Uncharacterized protein Fot_52147 [Forsythia ovata]|uniref:Uncharacterized protein n=1 Tax=Forsythia ovata TaxID=205694 RepID=A0ABD1PJW1_9LAMI